MYKYTSSSLEISQTPSLYTFASHENHLIISLYSSSFSFFKIEIKMIVKGLRTTQDRVSDLDQIKKTEEELSSPKTVLDSGEFRGKKGLKMWTEAEEDMESGGSSEEVESPKSVAMRGKRGKVHNQVLKIREEEAHIGKDIREGLSAKDMIGAVIRGCVDYNHYYNRSVRRPALDVVILSRPILPSSPLSGKTPVKAVH